MRFIARIQVMLKPAVNDPQGNAVLGSLHSLGFDGVRDVRVGKMLTLDVEAPDESAAHREVHEMCDKLLANPVIEAYEADIRSA